MLRQKCPYDVRNRNQKMRRRVAIGIEGGTCVGEGAKASLFGTCLWALTVMMNEVQ